MNVWSICLLNLRELIENYWRSTNSKSSININNLGILLIDTFYNHQIYRFN